MVGPEERKQPEKKKEKGPPIPVFTKKENATLAQKIEILKWHHAQAKPNQTATARHFDPIYPNLQLKQPRVSKWLDAEPQLQEQWNHEQQQGGSGNAKRLPLLNFDVQHAS